MSVPQRSHPPRRASRVRTKEAPITCRFTVASVTVAPRKKRMGWGLTTRLMKRVAKKAPTPAPKTPRASL